jgi:hypothetical protein
MKIFDLLEIIQNLYGSLSIEIELAKSTAHLSENCTFIQKQHIYPKTEHLSKNGTFVQKQH